MTAPTQDVSQLFQQVVDPTADATVTHAARLAAHNPSDGQTWTGVTTPEPTSEIARVAGHEPGGGWGFGATPQASVGETSTGRALPAPVPGREAWAAGGSGRGASAAVDLGLSADFA